MDGMEGPSGSKGRVMSVSVQHYHHGAEASPDSPGVGMGFQPLRVTIACS